jgi:2-oxoglutarate dehydrogenase E2 component (dihydrolipoamide succinyltransferase)
MAQIEIVMPKMGESIIEATILKWVKKIGERVEMDEPILEIATDKVDSEVPSPVTGILTKILFEENAVVAVGTCIAYLETDTENAADTPPSSSAETPIAAPAAANPEATATAQLTETVLAEPLPKASESNRFYSPLVRTIAKEEKISAAELDNLTGTGQGGRVTKSDVLQLVEMRKNGATMPTVAAPVSPKAAPTQSNHFAAPTVAPAQVVSTASVSGNVEIIEMDRMRKLIADHMVMSKHTSPHVTSFVEADVTNLVNWRNRIKGEYKKKYNENITFTPIFIEAVCRALRDFPMVNSSVEGTKILVKKDLNIGMAAALPSGNLIVPVIKNADYLNLVGLTKQVNDLANRARQNQLKPDEVQGGTFTLTNVGSFGNVMGTPIINQPQVAILAVGAIKKKPAVLETEHGDVIAIRQMMFLSLSYDHRVVDGMLGGSFLRRVADYLEQFDPNRGI